MSLTFERWYPWFFAVAFALASWLADLPLPAEQNFSALLSAAISLSAILVGFLATMKSILMAMPTVMERLSAANYLTDLADYLMSATRANLFFCVLNIAGFFKVPAMWPALYATFWFGGGVLALLCFWRATKIMVLILRGGVS